MKFKKLLTVVIAAVMAVSALCVPTSAATKKSKTEEMGDYESCYYLNDGLEKQIKLSTANSLKFDVTTKNSTFTDQSLFKLEGAKSNYVFAPYTFKLSRKDKVTITINTKKNFTSEGTDMYLIDAEDDEWLSARSFSRASKFDTKSYSASFSLSKGRYYIVFVSYAGYTEGEYSISLNAPKHVENKPVVEAQALSKRRVKLSWNKIPNATKYKVYKYSGGTYKEIATTKKTSYTIKKGLVAGNVYNYAVTAYVKGRWTTVTTDQNVAVTARK